MQSSREIAQVFSDGSIQMLRPVGSSAIPAKPATLGALIITDTMLGVPLHNYSIIYPQNPILNMKALILGNRKK